MKQLRINGKAEKALQDSIIKWERMAIAIDNGRNYEGPSASNCPLCKLYNETFNAETCQQCPIYLETGKEFCEGTPFTKFQSTICTADKYRHALKEIKLLRKIKNNSTVVKGKKNRVLWGN